MKQFVNSITKISGFFASHAWARIGFYAVLAAALLIMYAGMEQSEVAFIYNEF